MGRGGEDGVVQQILPVAGELLARDDAAGDRALAPARAGQDHFFTQRRVPSLGQGQHRDGQGLQRLHQAKAGGLVEAQHMARDLLAFAGGQGDVVGLGDQIADGQDDAVLADQDAVADPLSAQRARGEGVGRHIGVQPHHRRQRPVQVEGIVLRLRLGLVRHAPILEPFFHAGAFQAVLGGSGSESPLAARCRIAGAIAPVRVGRRFAQTSTTILPTCWLDSR